MRLGKVFFESLLNTASEGVVVQDRDSRIVWCNPAAEEILGLDRSDLHGRTSDDPGWSAIHEDGSPFPGDRHPSMVALKTGQPSRGVVMGIHHHRRGRVWISINATVVEWSAGAPSLVMTTFADISERKHALDALASANTELERFAYVASHDLREPLRTITAFSELLQRRFVAEGDGEAREFAGLVIDAARRMDDLIGGLAHYAATHGKPAPFAPINLADALEIAEANLHQWIAETGTVLQVSDLPTIDGDLLQMGQVFQNLLGNAIKFSKPGVAPRIAVTAAWAGGRWLVSVADNGIGIESTGQDIFELFRRLHGHGSYPGSGVGLAITKAIIQRHGGRIWHEPAPDGARICFDLPGERGCGG
ncbi:MAG: ATP-binding protein [Actinomycetota bacterium]